MKVIKIYLKLLNSVLSPASKKRYDDTIQFPTDENQFLIH